MFSRRELATTLLVSAGGVLLPRPLLARAGGERKFLFVFCRGGWDTSYVFTPLLKHPSLVPEEGAEQVEIESQYQRLGTSRGIRVEITISKAGASRGEQSRDHKFKGWQ